MNVKREVLQHERLKLSKYERLTIAGFVGVALADVTADHFLGGERVSRLLNLNFGMVLLYNDCTMFLEGRKMEMVGRKPPEITWLT